MGLTVGPLHARRSIFIEAAPDRVWDHFVDQKAICGWLDQGHSVEVFEPEVGGSVRLSIEIDGSKAYFGGHVLVVAPNSELSFESQWEGERAWAVPTFWTIRLTGMYAGTLVELFHHGFERLGSGAADALEDYEHGWTVQHLASLRSLAEAA